jgi:hypothetical protein
MLQTTWRVAGSLIVRAWRFVGNVMFVLLRVCYAVYRYLFDNCDRTYFCFEKIDSRGWMWMLDVGRLNIVGGPVVNLQPKLVVYDLNAGCIVRTHLFPDNVFPANNSFANDIVVDEERGLAYMTDTWGKVTL